MKSDGAIIDRFYAGLSNGNLDECLACLTPDAVIWHCFDGLEQDRDNSHAAWQGLVAAFPERLFDDVRRHEIAGGFVQQHMMTARTVSGEYVGWPICIVVKVKDGLISRIDEYIDRAGRFPVTALVGQVTPGL